MKPKRPKLILDDYIILHTLGRKHTHSDLRMTDGSPSTVEHKICNGNNFLNISAKYFKYVLPYGAIRALSRQIFI